MSQEHQMKISNIKPFGPLIMKVELSTNILEKMVDITDKILLSNDKVHWGNHLAGKIDNEYLIPNNILREENLYNFFSDLVSRYVISCSQHKKFNKQIKLDVNIPEGQTWIVSQYENEYNPVHNHTDGGVNSLKGDFSVSMVMYLKVPKFKKRHIKGKTDKSDVTSITFKDEDGSIAFINNSTASPLEVGALTFKPEVGDLYIFPANLFHTVYPFIGEGERRSVSLNARHNFVTVEENQSIQKEIKLPKLRRNINE